MLPMQHSSLHVLEVKGYCLKYIHLHASFVTKKQKRKLPTAQTDILTLQAVEVPLDIC